MAWVWSPNVINPLPNISLAPYRPGARCVDRAGIIGYWTGYQGQGAYTTLHGPTEREIEGVAGDPRLSAFAYFDYGTAHGKQVDWTLESDPAAFAAWHTAIRAQPIATAGSAG